MVDAHLLEIHHIVRAGFDGMFHLFQLGEQVDFPLLQSFQHPSRHLFPLRFQHFQILFHRIQFLLQNLLLNIRWLRYLPELVVRHDDTIPIIILDVVKEPYPVFGGEILFRGIEDFGVGICRSVALGNLPDVGFQPDNHRFVRQPQSLHFLCCNAHNQCFTRSDLVINYATSVLF